MKILMLFLFLLCPIYGLDYVEYLALAEDEKEKLAKRYVKEKGDLNAIRLKAYAIYGDVEKEELFHMAVMMEDFYKQFKKQFKGSFKNRRTPELYLMKDHQSMTKAYQDWLSPAKGSVPGWAAGFFSRYGSKRALFGNAEHGPQTISTMKHEGTHQLLDAYLGTRVPTWFNEGTAEVFETFEMDRSMENNLAQNIHSSPHPYNAFERFKGKRIPFEELIQLDGEEWLKAKGDRVNLQYMSSWIAIHFMLNNKKGISVYQKLLSAIKNNRVDSKKLFTESTMKQLDELIRHHHEEVIVPHAKHVGRIEAHREKDMIDQMMQLSEAYQKEWPENPEAEFYVLFSKLLSPSLPKEDEDPFSKKLIALEREDFKHPEFDFALALAYHQEGDERRAERFLRQMLANAPRHQPSLDLQAKWSEK